MSKISPDSLLEGLQWRYATKKFDPAQKISDSDWNTLAESLRLAPSSFGLQPWKFLVVQSPDLRKKLTPASWNQPQIETCSHLVVVTHLKSISEDYVHHFIKTVADTQGIPEDSLKGYQDMINGSVKARPDAAIAQWNARQAYIAMGSFMTIAGLLQVDVCPMEGISPEKYDEILGLTNTPYTSIAVLAAGYRAHDDKDQHRKKVRFGSSEVIQFL